MATGGSLCDKRTPIVDSLFYAIGDLLAVDGDVGPDVENIRFGERRESVDAHFCLGARFRSVLFMPAVFHHLDFTAGLSAVNHVATLALQESFFYLGRQGPAFFVSPAFLGVLSFERVAEDIFDARITATGKAFVDSRFKVGG
jgi:hypothetical protein